MSDPYVGKSAHVLFTIDGHAFRAFSYTATNAFGLIGPELNGVFIGSDNDKRVVADQLFCGDVSKQNQLLQDLPKWGATQLTEFLNSQSRRVRYIPSFAADLKELKKRNRSVKSWLKPVDFAELKDSKFMTAAEKQKVAEAWEYLLRSRITLLPGKVWEVNFFRDCLYNHMNQHLGFIAHYNRLGFFDVQLQRDGDLLRNVEMFSKNVDNAGSPMDERAWGANKTYADVNKLIVKISKYYLPKLRRAMKEAA